MTTDIKGLMKEARGWHAGHSNDSQRMVWLMNKLCDALEAMAGEVARIRVALDIAHDDLNPVTMAETWVNKARLLDDQVVGLLAERDRLKVALEPFSRAAARLERIQYLTGTGDEVPIGMGIMPEHLKAARAALGDAS